MRSWTLEPAGIEAVAVAHAAFEVESPLEARVFQLEPPLVEYSSRKKSPESSPASRWPWK